MENEILEKKYLSFKKNVEDVLRSFSTKHGNTMKEIKSDIAKMKEEIRTFESRIPQKCSCHEDIIILDSKIATLEGKMNSEENLESVHMKVINMEEQVKNINDHFDDERSKKNKQDEEIDILKEKSENNKLELLNLNINIAKLEEEHSRLIGKKKQIDMNECMTTEDVNMSVSMESNSDVKIDENIQRLPLQQRKEKYFECYKCDKRFLNRFKVEKHLVSIHNENKVFNCTKCETKFVSEWRLKRHQDCHVEKTQRKCHYFNNAVECPFQEYGCKFLHVEAEVCKFGKHCRRTMCQYRH